MKPRARGTVAAAALLMVAGISGSALLGVTVAEGAGPAPRAGQSSYYNTPTGPPATYGYQTSPPETSPPVTSPPVTSPPVTSPPVTSPPVTSPPVTSPPETAPPGNGLPVTGVRSLTLAGVGLVLVGLGILTWVLTGRRRIRA